MKKAQVIWSDQALVNLETIFDFLEEKSPIAAQRIIEELIGRANQLETFPESGSIQQNLNVKSEYRYLAEGNYKIIYRYQVEQQVVLLRKCLTFASIQRK